LGQFSAQCGGALISDQEIITASHCVVENGKVKNPSDFFVRLGEHNIDKKAKEDAEKDYRVIKVTAHPEFEAKVYKNDIAILKLDQKVIIDTFENSFECSESKVSYSLNSTNY
jgi:trypsin